MADLPVVLVVDDTDSHMSLLMSLLHDRAEVLWAPRLAEGQKFFEENRGGLAVIIMDGCVESSQLDTLPLIKSIRQAGYTGPMIACSADRGYRGRMVEAGCSHESEKLDLPTLVFELLGLEKVSIGL